MTGHEVVSDLVSGSLEVFARVRAFFHTVAYVCVGDPTMFDLQTAHTVPEKVFALNQRTYHGRTLPPDFVVMAWAQSRHALSSHMRMSKPAKLKEVLLNGSLWESY